MMIEEFLKDPGNVDLNRLYSYSELFGPFKCFKCDDTCWLIAVSEAERETLPDERYEASVKALNMGLATCGDHIQDAFEELK